MDKVSQNFRAESEFVKLLLSLPALCNEKEMEKLTKLAEKNVEFAPIVVKLIEDHLLTFKKKWRGYFNLMENIIQNKKVGDIYRPLFSNNIVSLFHRLFRAADHSNRMSMFTRRSKWSGLFPLATLYALDLKLKSVDPTLPVMAPPPRVSPQPSIAQVSSLPSPSNARGKELKRKVRSEDDCVQQPEKKRKDDREKASSNRCLLHNDKNRPNGIQRAEKRKLDDQREEAGGMLLRLRQKESLVIPPLVSAITRNFSIPISSILCDPRFRVEVHVEDCSHPSVLERIRSKESIGKVKEAKCDRKRKRETDEIPSAKRREVLDLGDYSLQPMFLRPRRKESLVIPPLVPARSLISVPASILRDPRFQLKIGVQPPAVIRLKKSTRKLKETKSDRKRKRETDEIPSAKRVLLDPADFALRMNVSVPRLPDLIAVSPQKATSSVPYVIPDFLVSSASDNDVLDYVDSWIDHPVFAPVHEYVTNLIACENSACPILSGAIEIDNDLQSFSREIAPRFVVDESTAPSSTADAVLDEYLEYLISLPDIDLESPPPSVAVAAPSPWARRIPAPAPSPREEKEILIRNTRLRQRNLPPPPKEQEPSPERIYAKRGVWSGRN